MTYEHTLKQKSNLTTFPYIHSNSDLNGLVQTDLCNVPTLRFTVHTYTLFFCSVLIYALWTGLSYPEGP